MAFFTQLKFLFSSPQEIDISPIDSQDIKVIWDRLALEYFPLHTNLNEYKVIWSTRPQRRVLASCNIHKKIVRVAPAMRLPEAAPYLEALLYHELCHAVVGIGVKNGRRDIHSKDFKALESKHPCIISLDNWIKSGGWINAVRKSTRRINKLRKLTLSA